MTPSPDNTNRWHVLEGRGGWYDIAYSTEGKTARNIVATAFSLGRAEIIRDALMAAYGGKVYERPRQPIGLLPRATPDNPDGDFT
jgi:hypothetical protein